MPKVIDSHITCLVLWWGFRGRPIQWCNCRWPWVTPTTVSRSQYSLKVNSSQTVHPIHDIFGCRLVFSGSAERMVLFPVRYMAALSRVTLASAGLSCWFRPPNAQNLLPKICTKSPISRLVWQIDRRCLGLPGGFRRWPIQWNHAKCCGASPCCHGNEIWARRGDLVAYRFVFTLVSWSLCCCCCIGL